MFGGRNGGKGSRFVLGGVSVVVYVDRRYLLEAFVCFFHSDAALSLT
jgi:hypothetical protein